MKKFRYIIATVFVVAMGTTIFFGCEKENNKINNNLKTDLKIQKSENYQEQVRFYLCEGLISFKQSLEPYYSQSTSYEGFINLLEVNEEETSELGNNLLMLAYNCLNNGHSDEYIHNHYTGKYMAEVAIYLMNNPDSDGSELFATTAVDGGNYPCKWWQLFCHINQFVEWLNSEKVQKAIQTIKEILGIIKDANETFAAF